MVAWYIHRCLAVSNCAQNSKLNQNRGFTTVTEPESEAEPTVFAPIVVLDRIGLGCCTLASVCTVISIIIGIWGIG